MFTDRPNGIYPVPDDEDRVVVVAGPCIRIIGRWCPHRPKSDPRAADLLISGRAEPDGRLKCQHRAHLWDVGSGAYCGRATAPDLEVHTLDGHRVGGAGEEFRQDAAGGAA